MNAWIAAGGIVGVLVIGLMFQEWRIDRLKSNLVTYKVTIEEHEDAARKSEAALNQCEQINIANQEEAERFKTKAEKSAERVALLQNELNNAIDIIPIQAEQFNDEECRTLDEPLPAEFVDWLRGS